VRELRWIGEIKKKKKKKKKERQKADGLEIGGSNHKLACSKIYSCYPKFS
jgi:hypothetical protein